MIPLKKTAVSNVETIIENLQMAMAEAGPMPKDNVSIGYLVWELKRLAGFLANPNVYRLVVRTMSPDTGYVLHDQTKLLPLKLPRPTKDGATVIEAIRSQLPMIQMPADATAHGGNASSGDDLLDMVFGSSFWSIDSEQNPHWDASVSVYHDPPREGEAWDDRVKNVASHYSTQAMYCEITNRHKRKWFMRRQEAAEKAWLELIPQIEAMFKAGDYASVYHLAIAIEELGKGGKYRTLNPEEHEEWELHDRHRVKDAGVLVPLFKEAGLKMPEIPEDWYSEDRVERITTQDFYGNHRFYDSIQEAWQWIDEQEIEKLRGMTLCWNRGGTDPPTFQMRKKRLKERAVREQVEVSAETARSHSISWDFSLSDGSPGKPRVLLLKQITTAAPDGSSLTNEEVTALPGYDAPAIEKSLASAVPLIKTADLLSDAFSVPDGFDAKNMLITVETSPASVKTFEDPFEAMRVARQLVETGEDKVLVHIQWDDFPIEEFPQPPEGESYGWEEFLELEGKIQDITQEEALALVPASIAPWQRARFIHSISRESRPEMPATFAFTKLKSGSVLLRSEKGAEWEILHKTFLSSDRLWVLGKNAIDFCIKSVKLASQAVPLTKVSGRRSPEGMDRERARKKLLSIQRAQERADQGRSRDTLVSFILEVLNRSAVPMSVKQITSQVAKLDVVSKVSDFTEGAVHKALGRLIEQGAAERSENLAGQNGTDPVYLYSANSAPKPLTAIASKSRTIDQLLPELVAAAQRVYDDWHEDDEDLGGGGICDMIAEEQAQVLEQHGIHATTMLGTVGDHHVFVVAATPEGVFEVNVSPYVYETGAAYTWHKIPDVTFEPSDIQVTLLDPNPDAFADYEEQMCKDAVAVQKIEKIAAYAEPTDAEREEFLALVEAAKTKLPPGVPETKLRVRLYPFVKPHEIDLGRRRKPGADEPEGWFDPNPPAHQWEEVTALEWKNGLAGEIKTTGPVGFGAPRKMVWVDLDTDDKLLWWAFDQAPGWIRDHELRGRFQLKGLAGLAGKTSVAGLIVKQADVLSQALAVPDGFSTEHIKVLVESRREFGDSRGESKWFEDPIEALNFARNEADHVYEVIVNIYWKDFVTFGATNSNSMILYQLKEQGKVQKITEVEANAHLSRPVSGHNEYWLGKSMRGVSVITFLAERGWFEAAIPVFEEITLLFAVGAWGTVMYNLGEKNLQASLASVQIPLTKQASRTWDLEWIFAEPEDQLDQAHIGTESETGFWQFVQMKNFEPIFYPHPYTTLQSKTFPEYMLMALNEVLRQGELRQIQEGDFVQVNHPDGRTFRFTLEPYVVKDLEWPNGKMTEVEKTKFRFVAASAQVPVIKRASIPQMPDFPASLRYGFFVVWAHEGTLGEKKYDRAEKFETFEQAYEWAEARNGPGSIARIQVQMGSDTTKLVSKQKRLTAARAFLETKQNFAETLAAYDKGLQHLEKKLRADLISEDVFDDDHKSLADRLFPVYEMPLQFNTKAIWHARDGEWKPGPKIQVLQDTCRTRLDWNTGQPFVGEPYMKQLTEEEWNQLP